MIDFLDFLIIYFGIGCFYSIFFAFYSKKFMYEAINNKHLKETFKHQKLSDPYLMYTIPIYLITIGPVWIFHYALLRRQWSFVLYILQDKEDDVYE